MVTTKPRMTRRNTMARRRKRTTNIFSDSEPDSDPSEPKGTPEQSEPKEHPKDIRSVMHTHSYIQIVKWSFNAQQKMFTLTKVNGGIKVLDIMQLMVLAPPFVFDLEKLPLDNPDNGSDGRIAIKWVKARAQALRGEKLITFYGTKGADNRHAGLTTTKITYRESDTTPYFYSAALNAKDHLKL
ncbi:hypothetical protein E3N88_03957 [Mikania micrantha]|uniref:Uncharacterized protein n=1 Tax=Mikania micrantha TaxID=192012 RepID=A0A5N6PT02_9ASTR|nr:hypothetical protein E3N88_03957 [Mikania micrantha]